MCRGGFIRGGLEAGEKTGAKAIEMVKTASIGFKIHFKNLFLA